MKPFRCLLTAGPTREHLDPVRFLSNGSSGKMGFALAQNAAERGWTVDLVAGPVALTASPPIRVHQVVSAQEMFAVCASLFEHCDLFIAVAAVADYRPRQVSAEKLKKNALSQVLELEPTIDILKTLAARKSAHQVVVGFAAETHEVENYARRKLEEKKLNWIVANDVGRSDIGMNAADNTVVLLSRDGRRWTFGPAPKAEVAKFILDTIGCGP